ncbi:serine protease 33-like [Mixophyes fleayi]|uniref:serine protease 33-like n=1 Tax=Mixophyes fleayi TaxID=3061075 RepID=UPI003F4DF43D
MQKLTLGIIGRGQYGEISLLLLALGIVLGTATYTGCGRPAFSQRVVGGENSMLGKWPWQVSIVINNIHTCGGSLISRSWVASAAHCVRGTDLSKYLVMMGMVNLTHVNDAGVIIAPIKNILIHPIYKGEGTSGDLVLFELESPVTFTSYIQPICLPSPNQDFPDGMMCWLTGWGQITEHVNLAAPYTLQEVELPLINSSACDNMFSDGFMYPLEMVKDDMICAGYPQGGKDGCQGDSGGPLSCRLGNSWILVGVVSWGVGCAEPNKPGVYTKVSSFAPWIQENAKLNDTVTSENNITVTTVNINTFTTATTVNINTFTTATTVNINTFTTKKQTEYAQSLTHSKILHEGSTGAELRPRMSTSLLLLAVLFGRILDIL